MLLFSLILNPSFSLVLLFSLILDFSLSLSLFSVLLIINLFLLLLLILLIRLFLFLNPLFLFFHFFLLFSLFFFNCCHLSCQWLILLVRILLCHRCLSTACILLRWDRAERHAALDEGARWRVQALLV